MKIVKTKTICDRCGKEIHGLMPKKATWLTYLATMRKATLKTQEADRFGYLCEKDLLNENVETVNAVFCYQDKRKEYDLCKSCGKELKRFLENK